METFISIIMPAYNAEQFIAESINSVLQQTYKEWELLIVDDGSTDNTKEVIGKYCAADSRIKYFYHKNQKQGKTRNLALQYAKGEFITFLDADDIWVPEKLEKQLSASSNYPDISIFFTSGYFFYSNNFDNRVVYDSAEGFFTGDEMYKLQYQRNYIPVLSVLMRKEIINQIGLQEERLYFQGCEDWDYWLRAASLGARFYGSEEKLFYYRRHESNMSSDNLAMRLAQACIFIKNYEKQRFTHAETRKIFKPLIVPLVIDLLLKHKIKQASFLLKMAFKKIPVLSIKFSYPVFKLMGRFCIKPILKIDRLETLLIKQ